MRSYWLRNLNWNSLDWDSLKDKLWFFKMSEWPAPLFKIEIVTCPSLWNWESELALNIKWRKWLVHGIKRVICPSSRNQEIDLPLFMKLTCTFAWFKKLNKNSQLSFNVREPTFLSQFLLNYKNDPHWIPFPIK